MTAPKLPDGSDAWFVRKRTRGGTSLQPCSATGWIVTIAFVMANLIFGIALSFFAIADNPGLLMGALTIFVVGLVLYLIFVFRMSVRLP